MPGKAEETLTALCPKSLGVMGLIHQQQSTGLRELRGKSRPAAKVRHELKGRGLSAPMRMQPHRGHNQQAQRQGTQQGSRRKQHSEGFAKTHFIGQNCAAPR